MESKEVVVEVDNMDDNMESKEVVVEVDVLQSEGEVDLIGEGK